MLNYLQAVLGTQRVSVQRRGMRCATMALITVAVLAGCGEKEKKPGQALASVDGVEITALQLNDELQRAGATAAQQDTASKQLLEALIDRQLLESAALKDKLDRDPKVLQTIERAKSLAIAQAYLQKRVGTLAPPTKAEVADYFEKHPEFFSNRKQFDMLQLVVASKDLDAPMKAFLDNAKSLDEVVQYLASRQIKFARNQVSRTTADLPPALSQKLASMPKGQIFIVAEGERSLLVTVSAIKDAPVTLETAAPQIGQYLLNAKNKEAAAAELARLRAAAKIAYLNKASAPAAAPAVPVVPASDADAATRGAAGLK